MTCQRLLVAIVWTETLPLSGAKLANAVRRAVTVAAATSSPAAVAVPAEFNAAAVTPVSTSGVAPFMICCDVEVDVIVIEPPVASTVRPAATSMTAETSLRITLRDSATAIATANPKGANEAATDTAMVMAVIDERSVRLDRDRAGTHPGRRRRR